MNTPTDIAELRRLHEAATKSENWQESALFTEACKLSLPALLDELEAAREEVREESNRWVSVIRGIDPEALCDFHDEHGSEEYLKAWLDARDRHTKLIGAAEKLEQLAGKFGGQFVGTRRYNTDELLEIAAQLRREAEKGVAGRSVKQNGKKPKPTRWTI